MQGEEPVSGGSPPSSSQKLSARTFTSSLLEPGSIVKENRPEYGTLSDQERARSKKEGLAATYDIDDLISLNVLAKWRGTILTNRTLVVETIVWGGLYWSVFVLFICIRWENFDKFVGQEVTIRAFIAMFSTLIGLLLSFYTALNLGRWWKMRDGVQMIQEGCKKLTMLVFSGVTNDQVLHDAIHRYSRASLFMIFAASHHKDGDDPPFRRAVKIGLLTVEEADMLAICNPHATFVHAETLWIWMANAVTRLHEQGRTKGPPHYCALMAAVEQGRSGVSHIQSYLETPIPMGYVHLLCLMVKIHNFLITVLMAMATVKLAGGEHGFQAVGVFRTAFRAFFMPFLYNSILILNAEVTDPFGCDAADFDFSMYDVNMLVSCKSFYKATNVHVPDCLANKVYKKWQPTSTEGP